MQTLVSTTATARSEASIPWGVVCLNLMTTLSLAFPSSRLSSYTNAVRVRRTANALPAKLAGDIPCIRRTLYPGAALRVRKKLGVRLTVIYQNCMLLPHAIVEAIS